METSIFCVYNLERRVFLSSKVTIVDGLNEPLKVVRLLVSGLGVDAKSGLWLTNLHGTLTTPKLFPYDLACLDKELRVVETIEVLPGIEFPPHRREVSSAVVLPSDTLRTTQTRVGDRLLVCSMEQADQLLAELAAQKDPELISHDTPAQTVLVGMATGAADLQSEVKVEEPPPTPQSSSISITEAIAEKPDVPATPVTPGVERWAGFEDLFANWVDSPAAPPSWIVQKAREREAEITTKNQDPVPTTPASVPPPEQIRSEMAQTALPGPPVDPKKEPASKPAASKGPNSVPAPQPSQNTMFTIARYGMWQVSTPTAAAPIASAKRPGSNGVSSPNLKRDSAPKRAEAAQRENGTPAKKTPEIASPRAASSTPETQEGRLFSQSTEKPSAPLDGKKLATGGSVTAPGNGAPSTRMKSPVAPSTPGLESKLAAIPISESTVQASAKPVFPAATNRNTSKDRPADSSSKPASVDFAAAVQGKLDRLQIGSPTAATDSLAPKPAPVWGKKTSGENSGAGVKAQPAGPSEPQGPPATAGVRKSASEQRRVDSLTPAPKRFPKPEPDEKGTTKTSVERVEKNGKNGAQHEGLGAKFKRWLNPTPATKSDRRRAQRHYVPGMVAHYFTGGAPKPHDVADISMSGMYVQTDDRWVPETMIRMTLQKPCARGEKKQSITVLSRIVRRGSDGVAAEFVMEETLDPSSRDILPSQATDRFSLARFL